MTSSNGSAPDIETIPQVVKSAKPWWKSHRFLYIAGALVLMAVYIGIPWLRTNAIQVPSQSESQVTVGVFNSKPIKGIYGFPIAVTQDNASTVLFSCAFPDPKWSYATCFGKQELHNGTQVKVFWSEQPAGFIWGSVRRPSRIEKLNGEVLFPESEATRIVEQRIENGPSDIVISLLVFGILYFPLMLVLDRFDTFESRQKAYLNKRK